MIVLLLFSIVASPIKGKHSNIIYQFIIYFIANLQSDDSFFYCLKNYLFYGDYVNYFATTIQPRQDLKTCRYIFPLYLILKLFIARTKKEILDCLFFYFFYLSLTYPNEADLPEHKNGGNTT